MSEYEPLLQQALSLLHSGDAKKAFQTFRPVLPPMTERLATLLACADALKGHTPLDTHDLRGWHLVLTGGVLLHLSPHGFDEPALRALTRSASLAGANVLALLCEEGQRQKQWAGSRVPSSFFR